MNFLANELISLGKCIDTILYKQFNCNDSKPTANWEALFPINALSRRRLLTGLGVLRFPLGRNSCALGLSSDFAFLSADSVSALTSGT